MNSRQENRSKPSFKFIAWIITKYSLERFLSIYGEKMSKGFLKFCKLISNLILGQIIVSNLTNVDKPNSHINYGRIHKIRYKKPNIKYNDYLGLPFEMRLRKAIKQGQNHSFNPLTHQARWKTKTMISEIGFPTLTSDVLLNQKPTKQTSHE